MFRSGKTLRSLLTKVKPKTDPTDTTGVVYRIPCMDCDRSYIGETCRTLNVRLKEHQRCCRNFESQKSAVAKHAIEEDHRIDWSNSTVIDKEPQWHRRRLKEALHIKKHSNFNQDQGLTVSPIWNSDISATWVTELNTYHAATCPAIQHLNCMYTVIHFLSHLSHPYTPHWYLMFGFVNFSALTWWRPSYHGRNVVIIIIKKVSVVW